MRRILFFLTVADDIERKGNEIADNKIYEHIEFDFNQESI